MNDNSPSRKDFLAAGTLALGAALVASSAAADAAPNSQHLDVAAAEAAAAQAPDTFFPNGADKDVSTMITTLQAMKARDALPSLSSYGDAFKRVKGRDGSYYEQRARIDAKFSAPDPYLKDSGNFEPRLVEQLISQTSSLLERGIASRSEWRGLQDKSFTTWLAIRQFVELQAIHDTEVKNGYYEVGAADALGKYDNQVYIGLTQRATAQLYGQLFNPPGGSGIYADTTRTLVQNYATGIANKEGAVGDATDSTNLASENFDQAAASVTVQQELNKGQATGSGFLETAAARDAAYQTQSVATQRQRTVISRQLGALRSQAYTSPGGAYNYDEQAAPIQQRFEQDFSDALRRMGAIQAGMKVIYNYVKPFAPKSDPFDSALLWVRDALEFLVRFGTTEQTYVLPISVRAMVESDTPGSWKNGLDDDHRGGAWNFTIPQTLFPDQSFLRLRGMNVYAMVGSLNSSNAHVMYQAILQAPQSTAFIHGFDKSGAPFGLDSTGKSYGFDANGKFKGPMQSQSVPPLRSGRVYDRLSPRSADLVGAGTLFNASPLGNWRIVVTNKQKPPRLNHKKNDDSGQSLSGDFIGGEGAPDSTIEDVQIDLVVAFIPREAPPIRPTDYSAKV